MSEIDSLVPARHKELGFTSKELSAEHGLEIDTREKPLVAVIQRDVGVPDVATPVFQFVFQDKQQDEPRHISLWVEWVALHEALSLITDLSKKPDELMLTDLYGWPVNVVLDDLTWQQIQQQWEIDQTESSADLSRQMQPKIKFAAGKESEFSQTKRVEVSIEQLELNGETAFFFTYMSGADKKVLRKIGNPGEVEFELMVGASSFADFMLNQPVAPEIFISGETLIHGGAISSTDYFLPIATLRGLHSALKEQAKGLKTETVDVETLSAEVSELIDKWAQFQARAIAQKIENKKILVPLVAFFGALSVDAYLLIRLAIGFVKPIENFDVLCCMGLPSFATTVATFSWMMNSIDTAKSAVNASAAEQSQVWTEIDQKMKESVRREVAVIKATLRGKNG